MVKKVKMPLPLKVDLTQKKQGFGFLLIGIVVALILGILASVFTWGTAWIWSVLILGVVVGFANIFHKEGVLFVLTLLTLTFMLGFLAGVTLFPVWLVTLFNAVMYLTAPVAAIVSLKVLYALAVK